MAAYEVLLLNTAIPQIQAAQSGDTYVVPRDIAINATAIISANSATDALRITQTGAGNAILVEDSANPDSTPFVVTAAGDVGIGTSSPQGLLDVRKDQVAATRVIANNQIASNGASTNFDYYFGTTRLGGLVHGFNASGAYWNLDVWNGSAATTRLAVDASGNLGLGVTPSALWDSAFRAIQVGSLTSLAYNNGFGQTHLLNNAIYTTSWVYQTSGVAAVRYDQRNGEHQWFRSTSAQVAGTDPVFSQAMTLDASGNLGIGTTSPAFAGVGTAITINNTNASTGTILSLQSATTNRGYLFANNTNVVLSAVTSIPLIFNTADTERARITSGGDFLIGGITAVSIGTKLEVNNATGASAAFVTAQVGDYTVYSHNKATSGDNSFINFGTEATFTGRGSITYNRTGGLVAYNTTSDYRAKDILGPVANSGATIDALKVYEGKMKGATQSRPMLVAHEAQEHVPYAVTGEKDAVNADGTPKYQQMDVSSLVPLLLAEIQSLRARVKALEGA